MPRAGLTPGGKLVFPPDCFHVRSSSALQGSWLGSREPVRGQPLLAAAGPPSPWRWEDRAGLLGAFLCPCHLQTEPRGQDCLRGRPRGVVAVGGAMQQFGITGASASTMSHLEFCAGEQDHSLSCLSPAENQSTSGAGLQAARSVPILRAA